MDQALFIKLRREIETADRADLLDLAGDFAWLEAALRIRINQVGGVSDPSKGKEQDEYVDITVAAQRLGVSKSFLYRKKQLPFRKKIGSRVVFSALGLQKWADRQQEQ